MEKNIGKRTKAPPVLNTPIEKKVKIQSTLTSLVSSAGKDNSSSSSPRYNRLAREFFQTDVVTLSKKLLGKVIRRNLKNGDILRARIVETEAYKAPDDKGCHAYNNKRNKKTEAFWCDAGCWYVYTIYMPTNKCLNIVAADKDSPEAVLIRAAEPIEGLARMQEFRKSVGKNTPAQIRNLTNGPGKLGAALDIGVDYSCYDFCADGNDDAFIEAEEGYEIEDSNIVETFRVNIGYAQEYRFKKWRFFIKDNKCVSVQEQTKEFIESQSKSK